MVWPRGISARTSSSGRRLARGAHDDVAAVQRERAHAGCEERAADAVEHDVRAVPAGDLADGLRSSVAGSEISVAVAPWPRAISSLASVDAVPIVCAPTSAESWMQAAPRPPDAAGTSTQSPSVTCP